jgi:hypothetical protein
MKVATIISSSIALAVVGFASGRSTVAQVVAVQSVSFGSGDQYASTTDATYGWKFTVGGSDLSVTKLGLLDLGSSGFTDAHKVGIWDSANNLVASADFAAGQTGTFSDGFRYLDINPVSLTAGQSYSIGSWSAGNGTPDNVVQSAAAATYASGMTYNGASYAPPGSPGSGFAAPYQNFGGSQGVFGPNFEFTPVPEPKDYAVIGGLSLLAFAAIRRWRLGQG